MRELNIEFQERYKQLDKLCREMYSSSEGVSSYIQDMENTPYSERHTVNNWEKIYKELKHARWMRNQLAHDISIDIEFCEQSDIEFVEQFYSSIMKGNDPLSYTFRTKQAIVQNSTSSPNVSRESKTASVLSEENQNKSLWNKIIAKIKNWFS